MITNYQPTLADLRSFARTKRDQVLRWYAFRVVLGLSSIWFGFVLYPAFSSMSLDISPLDGVRNGNVIVFVTVLCSASLGAVFDNKNYTRWYLATKNFIGLLIVLIVSAIHIPLFTLQQMKDAPKTVVFVLSGVLLVLAVFLGRNNYLMTLLNTESLNEEGERKARDSMEKARDTKSEGGVRV